MSSGAGAGADAGDALAAGDIHGFLTAADLNVEKLMKEAAVRWFRPNEIYALLANHARFRVQAQPIDLPTTGTVALYDRKIVRNFRKDGHNWKKKKDGKTVQEAHEKLKIGNEERIHVYYARGEDDPAFFRRCYWLLDKDMEQFVLVHYRQTSEDNVVSVPTIEVESADAKSHHNSPIASVDSNSSSTHPEMPSALTTEANSELDKPTKAASYIRQDSQDEINKFWEGILKSSMNNSPVLYGEGVSFTVRESSPRTLMNSTDGVVNSNSVVNGTVVLPPNVGVDVCSSGLLPSTFTNNAYGITQTCGHILEDTTGAVSTSAPVSAADSTWQLIGTNALLDNSADERSLDQKSFRENSFSEEDILGFLNNDSSEPIVLTEQIAFRKTPYTITDVSPEWAFTTEETKVIVVGYFHEVAKHLSCMRMYCVFGNIFVPAEMIQDGVYRCKAMPNVAGCVNFFLSLDGRTPISQVLSFEFRSGGPSDLSASVLRSSDHSDDKLNLQLKIRLAHLLFSSIKKVQSKVNPESSKFAALASLSIEDDWLSQLKHSSNDNSSYICTLEKFLDLILKAKLQEWLLEKTIEGSKTIAHDHLGQGVIHLCAILDYNWAFRLFSLSEVSLDFRDAHGWTALHWAAYFGREKTVATLLSAGANPSLVTDPTPDFPGGCTAADLAAKKGFDGIAAYLAEKGLTAHFEAMSLSGNIEAVLNNQEKTWNGSSENLSEQEVCLKESLAAYRNAAGVASHIQAALRDRALKIQIKEIELAKSGNEAHHIIAAMKIQNAFRNHSRRKLMLAAARIQSHYRTWKTRKNFLNMRRQAIKIQAVFRGHQVRQKYRKIIWSVGVVEKAVLRWRKKRKGLRGIHIKSAEAMELDAESANNAEEEFYRASLLQAEDRYKRSVVRVQALFRSYRAQQEYRRMKIAHEQAKYELAQEHNPQYARADDFLD